MADLTGVVLKLGRATRLVEELHARHDAYIMSEPFAMETHDEPVGDFDAYFRLKQPLPMDFGLLIGDALHNARSALDHMAWQLVLAGGGTPTDQTAFPIAKDAKTFEEWVERRLRGAAPDAVAAVRALKPWKGSDEQLWRLHRLDAVDKHRLLTPVVAAQRSFGLRGTFNLPGATRSRFRRSC